MPQIKFAPVFRPLLKPSRYKGAFGGRGSGKSQFFASLLVARALQTPGLRAVCIREVQKSLAQSAKQGVQQKIEEFGVGPLFNVGKAEIKTPGGGVIIFEGMKNHTADSIKSLEGFDVAWVEEAQTLSETSLRMLEPTIRKLKSEIWFSWNPQNADDPVDDLLRGAEHGKEVPPDTAIVRANFNDNPWFVTGTTLNDKREFDFRRDPDMYRHVWMGDYLTRSEAQVFRNWRTEWFEPPKSFEKLYAGCDWGFIDPTVLVVCFVRDRTLYIWREAYGLRCPLDKCATLFDKVDPDWSPRQVVNPNWRSLARRLDIVADSADPQNIKYMQTHGFPRMTAAIKGPDSVEAGIAFMQSYDIVVHPDCQNVIDELMHYSYKIDKKTDKITSELVDAENHTIDACRYALEGVRRNNTVTVSEFRPHH